MKKVTVIILTAVMLLSSCKDAKSAVEGSDTINAKENDMTEINGISVSDGYSINFSNDVYEYSVSIPAGRPAVPQITADGTGNYKVFQAFIPDTENSGTASVVAGDKIYRVTFEKTQDCGFVLQYDDIYHFSPSFELQSGEKYDFSSSNPDVVEVDKNGSIKAKALCDKPITVTASVNGKNADSITVDRVIKSPLNIFLIIGQSNAYGYHDVPSDTDLGTYFALQKSKCDCPIPGTVYCDDIGNSYDDVSFSGWYDLSKGRNGFSPSLGKEWYRLTGEKTFMLQTALGSMPIEPWTPDENLKCFGIDCFRETVDRFEFYRRKFEKDDSCYTVNRVYAFWLQGETCEEYLYSSETFYWNKNGVENYPYVGDWYNTKDPRVPKGMKLMTADEYYGYFIDMYQGFEESIGLQYMAILPVRAMIGVSSGCNRKSEQLIDIVPSRASQFALNYTDNGNIGIVTLKTEIGRTNKYPDKTAEGWGYLGCNNIHYDQIGYNALGKDSAYNLFMKLTEKSVSEKTEIKIMDYDGKVLSDGDSVKVFPYESRQISAIVLPLFSNDTTLYFKSANPEICTVDCYGLLTATPESKIGQTTTVTVSNGLSSKTIRVLIG